MEEDTEGPLVGDETGPGVTSSEMASSGAREARIWEEDHS